MEKEIFDGRWELIGVHNKRYVLKNIFNGKELSINYKQLVNIRNGVDTVSRIISRRIDSPTPFVTNYVTKNYKELKQRHIANRA